MKNQHQQKNQKKNKRSTVNPQINQQVQIQQQQMNHTIKSKSLKQQQKLQQKQQKLLSQQQQQQQQFYSSQDQDAFLLTQRVQSKLLQTVARLKSKDPSLYQLDKNIFDDDDFQEQQNLKKNIKNSNSNSQKNNQDNKKFTYKDMLAKGIKGDQDISSQSQEQQESQQLAPVMEQKKAINKFKQAINKQKNLISNKQKQQQDDLFINKGKITKQQKKSKQSNLLNKNKQQQDQLQNITKSMKPQSKKLLKNVWNDSQKMDQTDVFLKQYILGRKWLSKHLNNNNNQQQQQQVIDQQDQERSLQMDQYQAKYNFRFQQPDGDKIVQYPRKIQQSLRIKPQTRKDKRKKLQERKKIQQQQIRQQAEKKKEQIKQNILNKIHQKQQMQQQKSQSSDFQNDWFFCDDCGKAFQQQQTNYQCNQCQDYMLCEQCNQLIIHKHPLIKGFVPTGNGAPKKSVQLKYLSVLQPCKVCRRRLPESIKHYQNKDRTGNTTLMCEKCYDQSGLDIKKKFNFVEGKLSLSTNNLQEMLEKDPQKIKQLTNSKEIEEMVDQYLKYEFEDVIGGGLKTKFKYINVKPQGYGLSDQQILYGDDKQLNNYISVKKLAPYRQNPLKLRNNIFRKKVTSIDTSVNRNKHLLQKLNGDKKIRKSRMIDKIKYRAQMMKKKRQTKLKILNISNPDKEKQLFVPKSRLESYGVTVGKQVYSNNAKINRGNNNHHNHKNKDSKKNSK